MRQHLETSRTGDTKATWHETAKFRCRVTNKCEEIISLKLGLRLFLYYASSASSWARCLGFVAQNWVELFCQWGHPRFLLRSRRSNPDTAPPGNIGKHNEHPQCSRYAIWRCNLIDCYVIQSPDSLILNINYDWWFCLSFNDNSQWCFSMVTTNLLWTI